MGMDPWASCSAEKKECVGWVEKYFKDCVCDLPSETSFALGLAGLFCWGIAEIPQIITNYHSKSGHGVSLGLLLTWVLGDIFNLVGCLLEPVTLPTQFYTALLYTTVTVVLLLQTIYYDYFIRWWKNKRFNTDKEATDEEKPLNPEQDNSAKPIPATISSTSPRIAVHYTSARSLANSGSSPYSGASSYLRPARSGPSGIGAALRDSSDEEEEDENGTGYRSTSTRSKRTASRSVGYGTFIVASAGLPFQAKALMDMHKALVHGKYMMQETTLAEGHGSSPYGIMLGWIMAAIYMGGRLPQIYLNIKRGSVEGLNPLMFLFALVANATYVGSILVRSVEWARIKANAPWLLDAIVCVLLDLFIIIQFAYYKRRQTRIIHSHPDDDEGQDYKNLKDQLHR